MIIPPSDGPMFILIDWEFGETVDCCLGLRAYQTVIKELDLIFLSCKKIENNNLK